MKRSRVTIRSRKVNKLTAILALDLATTTGWALYSEGMQRPFFGALRLPPSPQEVGLPMEKLRQFLADQHRMHNLTDIVFEAQHVSARMSMDTVYKLIALGGMVEWFAHRIGVTPYKVMISEWRRHFLGRGANFGKDNPKELAIQQCATFGWFTNVADAAEACGILDYHMANMEQAGAKISRPWRDATLMKLR